MSSRPQCLHFRRPTLLELVPVVELVPGEVRTYEQTAGTALRLWIGALAERPVWVDRFFREGAWTVLELDLGAACRVRTADIEWGRAPNSGGLPQALVTLEDGSVSSALLDPGRAFLRHPDEAGLWDRVVSNPGDPAVRTGFAAWLEQHGDPEAWVFREPAPFALGSTRLDWVEAAWYLRLAPPDRRPPLWAFAGTTHPDRAVRFHLSDGNPVPPWVAYLLGVSRIRAAERTVTADHLAPARAVVQPAPSATTTAPTPSATGPPNGSPVSLGQSLDQLFPGYRTIRRIGAGAVGEVWEVAPPTSPDGVVAVKVIRNQGVRWGDPPYPVEGRAARRRSGIRHPFVASPFRCDVIDRTLYVQTERAAADLATHVQRQAALAGPASAARECIRLLWDAALGLDHIREAHDMQHADVKPTNLLVVNGRCKVGDTGMATTLSSKYLLAGGPVVFYDLDGVAPHYRTAGHVPWGLVIRRGATVYTADAGITPRYAPPEAYLGRIGPTFDQYSLALTFCEAVYGRLPFAGADGRIESRLSGVLDLGFVHPCFRSAVAKAVSPDPAGRYQSCEALVEALSWGATALHAG